MLIKFTEEQKMIRDMAREFTKNEIAPRDKWMDENGFDYELYEKVVAAGFMGINIPEEYGGGNGDAVETTIIVHEFAKGSASEATFLDAHWMAADLVLFHGTDAQKKKYLPQACAGKIFAFGLTEANAGSDAAGIKSTAVRGADGGWVLNGGKAWITNSGVAVLLHHPCHDRRRKGNHGISPSSCRKTPKG
jgi:alkylation response protein AidB-like acyl-CoA dehydrogenase